MADQHAFAVSRGWTPVDYGSRTRLYAKTLPNGQILECSIGAVITHEARWAEGPQD